MNQFRFFTPLLVLFLTSFVNPKNTPDKGLEDVDMYYCLENPMYHSNRPEESRGYFQICGMKNHDLQRTINDSMKIWTGRDHILTNFQGAQLGYTFRRPFGKRYSTYTGHYYGKSTIKFRWFEKVRTFSRKEINRDQGRFTPLYRLTFSVVRGHFFFIRKALKVFMVDLRNGKRMHPEIPLIVDSAKRDSFHVYVKSHLTTMLAAIKGKAEVIEKSEVPDTVMLCDNDLVNYLLTDSCWLVIQLKEEDTGNPKQVKTAGLTMCSNELAWFLEPGFREKIESYMDSIKP